ncbi:phenylpyruvate tautomerase PptA (4-oxalocrotonate tautomerase family) [Silvimonas terrae]|uniref:Phenylpyruvate tautomerase PptA (4-oxalocrotonate tautomerase family) n=1 Tax=Silvimonas terrae TaxID=300266 RepID=A0A840RH46_9NEIS|nr:tautomerase family protein [Silvimonas terrae]MBB5191646.1 phenylpyruvate tautomerase PptA (4-oxalocrotonate tautomerase family) [Silvimonas terrae]
MPLVRIDIRKHKDPTFAKRAGLQVFAALQATMNVPDHDLFQVLAEHDAEHMIYDPQYFGIPRSDGIIFVQITLNEGRTVEQKKALYQTLAAGLERELHVRQEDVFINLVEVKKENWSFGNGLAQYATS